MYICTLQLLSIKTSKKCRLINNSGNKGVHMSEPSFVVGWAYVLLRTFWPWFVGQYDL